MLSLRNSITIIVLSIILANSAFAQQETAAQAAISTTPAVLVYASAESLRLTSPGHVSQIRLEIYSANGEQVFDSDFHSGNILDWKTTDARQKMADGSYLCLVTVKDVRGHASQRFGTISLQAGQLSVTGRTREDQLSQAQSHALAASRQSQKIESAGNDTALTIVRENKERALTVTAHDGRNGQVASTTGALTFRTGDTLSNQATEQMRITPEGRVGIGTDNPQATLDVAGTIRARGGIVFDDGTVLKSSPGAGAQRVVAAAVAVGNTASVAAAGTGTANRLAKWSDNAGTLGDSLMAESNGNVGLGTTSPVERLHLADSNPVAIVLDDTSLPGNKLTLLNSNAAGPSLTYLTDSVGRSTFNLATVRWAPNSFGHSLDYSPATNVGTIRTWTTALFINSGRSGTAGNVGIGTTTPTQKLEVAGSIRLSGVDSALIFPDGTSMTTAARLGGANNWSGTNVFSAGLSAGGAAVTNVATPVAASDAANKIYVDASTVRFVPAAEQLSVGDANGTAPMINLRGGSTCCSGPGGHTPAWFKVFQNGSFVATGNLGIGVSPMQGKGYRTSWDSYKGAFRSGYADAEWDDANVGFFSWAGGSNSTAIGLYALAFGDTNQAESTSSIVFGSGNQVKGAAGFSAGAGNRVCDTYGVALGNNAKSGGPLINGKCDPDSFNIHGLAAVAIGYNVTADQDHTTAMGKFASNNGFTGTFIWSDGSATASADTFRNTANNEFAARATGGFRFRTNLAGTTGCNLPAGSGVFNCTSSRTTKENFLIVKGEDVLAKLRNLPVSTWNYISEGQQVRHMGPMAEDFYKAFSLGTGNTSIGVQDLAGVSLAAVKALEERTAQLQQKISEVEQLRSRLSTLEQRFAALEKLLQAGGNGQRTAESN